MHTINTIRLTSAEIAVMWAQYQSDSLAKCVLKFQQVSVMIWPWIILD